MLDATRIHDYLHQKQLLRWTFNTAGKDMTQALGASFAPVIADMMEHSRREERPARIGLASLGSQIGKTSFAQGILGTFQDKTAIERNDEYREGGYHPQASWKLPSGWIRHYDAAIVHSYYSLPSYLFNNVARLGLPLIDIAEHAGRDKNDLRFDVLSYMRVAVPDSRREITFFATPEIAQSEGFQKFLENARLFAAIPA